LKKNNNLFLISFILFFQAQDLYSNEAYYYWELACTARKDKLNYILPKVMKRHAIDMWIIIDKGRGSEPLYQDFGPATSYGSGIIIFTDRGGERVERAILGGEGGMVEDCGAFDIFSDPNNIRKFVSERDPIRIGINYSTANELMQMEGRHAVDGLSFTDYSNLKKELGEKYSSRLVSAELLISDFRSERVIGEIIEFSKVASTTIRLIERALSNEVITIGKTTQIDVGWWLEEKRQELGFERGWQPTVYLSPPDGIEIFNSNRVVRAGDVMQIDWGIGKNNYFTDLKRFAYVLEKNETEIPSWVQKAFANSIDVRNIIQKNVKPGKTGEVILEELRKQVRDAGYIYTELERPSNVPGIEVNIGMHSAGNLGHDQGGSIFAIYPIRKKYIVQPNSIISVEFIVFTPVDEWNGKKVPVNIEENALITERGIEWIHPPQSRVLIIR
tara:strand:- start:1708 stop:3039 length:1332 start_codon:yes stop_codon:yes gene_type:complete